MNLVSSESQDPGNRLILIFDSGSDSQSISDDHFMFFNYCAAQLMVGVGEMYPLPCVHLQLSENPNPPHSMTHERGPLSQISPNRDSLAVITPKSIIPTSLLTTTFFIFFLYLISETRLTLLSSSLARPQALEFVFILEFQSSFYFFLTIQKIINCRSIKHHAMQHLLYIHNFI